MELAYITSFKGSSVLREKIKIAEESCTNDSSCFSMNASFDFRIHFRFIVTESTNSRIVLFTFVIMTNELGPA